MAFKDKSKAIAYNNYDRISLIVPKGKKEVIQKKAEENGETLNSFINRAIDLLLGETE